MFMLSGGAALIFAFSRWLNDGQTPALLTEQLTHAEFGAGFTVWDLVIPLFIFIVGAVCRLPLQNIAVRAEEAGDSAPRYA